MATKAQGSFEVSATPHPPYDTDDGAVLGRTTFEKSFRGALEATSGVEMISAMTSKGSAGYVAIERVKGTLDGKEGTFVLQHSGTMNRGAPTLSVTVVPDSGTGALVGLSGSMQIEIKEGKHFYVLEYELGAD